MEVEHKYCIIIKRKSELLTKEEAEEKYNRLVKRHSRANVEVLKIVNVCPTIDPEEYCIVDENFKLNE